MNENQQSAPYNSNPVEPQVYSNQSGGNKNNIIILLLIFILLAVSIGIGIFLLSANSSESGVDRSVGGVTPTITSPVVTLSPTVTITQSNTPYPTSEVTVTPSPGVDEIPDGFVKYIEQGEMHMDADGNGVSFYHPVELDVLASGDDAFWGYVLDSNDEYISYTCPLDQVVEYSLLAASGDNVVVKMTEGYKDMTYDAGWSEDLVTCSDTNENMKYKVYEAEVGGNTSLPYMFHVSCRSNDMWCNDESINYIFSSYDYYPEVN